MVYADFESSLTSTGETNTLHMHRANSACCCVVCVFDCFSNNLYELLDENCVLELLKTLK